MKLNKQSGPIALLLALLLAFTAALPACGAETAAGAAVKDRFETIAPYIDENTYTVACADFARVDRKAIETWLEDVAKVAHTDPASAKALAENMAGTRRAMDAWLASFTKAGGRQIYLVMSLLDVHGPPVIIVPLEQGSDARAVAEFFVPSPPIDRPLHSYGASQADWSLHAEQIGAAIVVAPAVELRRVHELKSAARPDLAAAFASAGDAPVVVAAAPPADTRRVVEEEMPRLPAELGGGPTTTLTRGLSWVNLAVHFPPDVSIDLTVRARDAESAKALLGVADASLKSLTHYMEQDKERAGLAKIIAALNLAPSANNRDELNLTADKAGVSNLAAQLSEQLMRDRDSARSLQSMNNIKQLAIGCSLYANEHKGEWPDDLEKAAKAVGIGPEILIDPANPTPKSGYTYINPGNTSEIKDYSTRIVIYETQLSSIGRNVGFADGHVETFKEGEFQKLLKDAQEAAAKRVKRD